MVDFLLEKHNPWWHDRKEVNQDLVIKEFQEQKIKYNHPFLEQFQKKEAIYILRGPRRIGKTTLLKRLIKKLLHDNEPQENVFFYPCDRIEDFNQLYDLISLYLGSIRNKQKQAFIFLDEISFVTQWQRAVKSLADSGDLKRCTVLLTGSNALDLKYSSERLPGRRGKVQGKDVSYLPLSFSEFSTAVGQADENASLTDFFLCGGFPQSINQYYQQGFVSNFLYDAYLDWMEGDVHKIGKSEKLMYALVKEIFLHMGSTTSWYKLAKNAGIGSHSTVKDYLDIFENLFITFYLNYYSVEQKKVILRKNKKIYFQDPMIFHALRGKVDNFSEKYFQYSESFLGEDEMSGFIENMVAAHLYKKQGQLYYGHYQGKEIDFVLNQQNQNYYFEVKYQKNIRISDFSYWNKHCPLTVVTRNFDLQKENLQFISLKKFLQK
jgi:hypothetical protein